MVTSQCGQWTVYPQARHLTKLECPRRLWNRTTCWPASSVSSTASRSARENMLRLPAMSSLRMSTISTAGSGRPATRSRISSNTLWPRSVRA